MNSKLSRPEFKYYRSPKTVMARFTFKRTFKSAGLWALIFGLYFDQKTLAYAKGYPSAAAKTKIAASFNSNVGLNAILGRPHELNTIAGFANWNTLGVITIIGSIWAFLLATKYFRGEEDNGRRELLLAGQTTARRAAVNTLLGLGASLAVLFIVTALIFVAAGATKLINFSPTSSLFFALSCVCGAALFMSIGALTSQIMPTRSRASAMAAGIFGICFLLRAMADVTNLQWLLNLTPLGWIEKLQPLVGARPIWLLPILAVTVVLSTASVWLAGRRDLGASLVADKDTARARYALLSGPLRAELRLNRATFISWLLAIAAVSIFYGLLTKTAAQAFNQAGFIKQEFTKILRVSSNDLSILFLGIVFFLLMALVMAYVASAVTKVREEESEGYVDNFLVRPVGRLQWLVGRVSLIASVAVVACALSTLMVWLGETTQQAHVPLSTILPAGLNMLAPVLFILGAGIFTFGFWPRATSFITFGVLGWSFLLALIASGINLNHWLLDTSVLHQIALAPSTNPNWTIDSRMAIIGLTLCILGALAFNRRDLQAE